MQDAPSGHNQRSLKPRKPKRKAKVSEQRVRNPERLEYTKWIAVTQPFPIPTPVKEAIQTLRLAGHEAYLVGGSVRDFLLRRPTKDHDLATSAKPEEICELFPRAITVGKAFGVI